uniref:Uncharacterized protein n=1 Tax=Anguilla anguilla TaxID=7936 RepID=A0A0E9SSA5_ANGAN
MEARTCIHTNPTGIELFTPELVAISILYDLILLFVLVMKNGDLTVFGQQEETPFFN